MKRFKLALLLVSAIVIALPSWAADKIDSKIRFNDFYGEVKIRPNAEEDDSYEFVDLDTVIYEDDRIKTEEESGAILGLEDMSTYVIKPESTLIIHTEEGNVSKIEMIAGTMWGNIKKMAEGKSLEVEMSQCVCGVEGTSVKCEESGDSSAGNNLKDDEILIEGLEDNNNDKSNKKTKGKIIKISEINSLNLKNLTKKQLKNIKIIVPKNMSSKDLEKLKKNFSKMGIDSKKIKRAGSGVKTSKVICLKGEALVTSKINGQTSRIPAGISIVFDSEGHVKRGTISGNEKKELQDSLNQMFDKLDDNQLIEKINEQIKQIEQENDGLSSALSNMKSDSQTKSDSELIKALPSYNERLKQGKRLMSIYEEVKSCISVAEKRMVSKENKNFNVVIKNAKEAMDKLSKTVDETDAFIKELTQKLIKSNGFNFALGEETEKVERLYEEIGEIFTEVSELIKVGDEPSYDEIKNVAARCEALAKELDKVSSEIVDLSENGKLVLKKSYEDTKDILNNAIRDFSSVPEVNSSLIKSFNDIDNEVVSYSNSIRDFISKYKSISNSSSVVKSEYVTDVTRALASYDRIRRDYTKANRMYTETVNSFQNSSYKTREFYEVDESWERIDQALRDLDNEASELSSILDEVKTELESAIGGK